MAVFHGLGVQAFVNDYLFVFRSNFVMKMEGCACFVLINKGGMRRSSRVKICFEFGYISKRLEINCPKRLFYFTAPWLFTSMRLTFCVSSVNCNPFVNNGQILTKFSMLYSMAYFSAKFCTIRKDLGEGVPRKGLGNPAGV